MMLKKMLIALATVFLTAQAYAIPVTPLFHDANDPIGGNKKGIITIAEFFDYQCSHCMDMVPVVDAIVKANPDVRIVYKDFPIRGPMSEFAAKAALAANKQGKYVALNHAMFMTNQPLSEKHIYELAAQQGINIDKLKKDMKDPQIAEQLRINYQLAENLKLLGTPAFFIGKTFTRDGNSINFLFGAMSKDQLQDAVDHARKQK